MNFKTNWFPKVISKPIVSINMYDVYPLTDIVFLSATCLVKIHSAHNYQAKQVPPAFSHVLKNQTN